MNQGPDDTGTYDEISVAQGAKNPESTLKYEQENQQRTVQTRPGQTLSGGSGPETTSSTAQATNPCLDSSTVCSTSGDKAYSRHQETHFDRQRTGSAASSGELTVSSETSMTLMSVMGTNTPAPETTMSNPVPSCSGWMPGEENRDSTTKYQPEDQQRTVQTRLGQVLSVGSGPQTSSSTNPCMDSTTSSSRSEYIVYSRQEDTKYESQGTASASSSGGLVASSETLLTLMSETGTNTPASETTMSNPVPSCSGWMPGEENRDSTMKNQPEDRQRTVQTRPGQVSSVGSGPQTSSSTGHTTNPCKKSSTSSSESDNRTSSKQQETHIERQGTASASGSGGLTASSETSMTLMSVMGTNTSASDTTMSNPVPSCSSLMPVHPVGGSVSTNTEHSIQKISGDKVLELSHAMIKRGTESDYNMSMETVTQEVTGDKQVHFNISKIDIHEPRAVSICGEMHVGQSPSKKRKTENESPPTEIQELKHKTERSYKQWTEGMVMTEAASTIVDNIMKGTSWVTITGCPGEGKTTTGYLVLKHLHDRGREVFDIKTPDDYYKVRDTKQSVIMLNDIFGALSYDHDSVKRWQNVLADVLALREHRQDDGEDTQRSKKKKTPVLTVILISRLSVLKEASDHMGKYKHLLKENLVNLTEEKHSLPEMLEIWKYHAGQYGITIDNKLVGEVCYLDLPHGFAHCCKLFASMYSKNSQLNMEHFFLKPLDFLMDSMTSLMKDPQSGPLLREMLKNDGSLDLESIDDVEKQHQYQSQVESMQDTYLTLNGRAVEFHHPSVYDCAAFVLCHSSPTFVIDRCSMSFLNDRVRLKSLQQPNHDQTHTTVLVDCSVERLLKRFQQEFNDRNIAEVFSHASFFDKKFVARFIECVVPSPDLLQHVHDLFNIRDKHSNKSFLFLMTTSGSDEVLRYIHQYVELTEEEQSEALFGVCEHSSVSSLKFLLERYNNINLEVTDSDNQTPLLISTQTRSQDVIKQLLMKKVNVNSTDNEGMTPLLNICQHGVGGDGSVVKMLIEMGADLTVTSLGDTPLHLACSDEHGRLVTQLLDKGADVNKTDSNGDTPLHSACSFKHVGILTRLLDKGADVNKTNNDGDTPLSLACFNNHVDVVLLLLEKGASVNGDNEYVLVSSDDDDDDDDDYHDRWYYGFDDDDDDDEDDDEDDDDDIFRTPLQAASQAGSATIVSILLKKGADVNLADDTNRTPLHEACQWGQLEIVSILLANGANIKAKCNLYETPLHAACYSICGDEDECHGEYVGIVSLLKDKGALINARDHCGFTPLHFACGKYGHIDVVSLLLKRGAQINARDRYGFGPLHIACGTDGHVDVVLLLLESGADINATDNVGNSILHVACKYGKSRIVPLLLEKGIDINRTNDNGNSPLHVANGNDCDDFSLLRKEMISIEDCDTSKVVKLLLDKGAEINATNKLGNTPLHAACCSGDFDIVSLLQQKGANIKSQNKAGQTPLHLASKGAHFGPFSPLEELDSRDGHADVVSILQQKEDNINSMNESVETPSHFLSTDRQHDEPELPVLHARGRHADVVAFLLNIGADFNRITTTGDTPLHIASLGGKFDIVLLLLNKGADINTTNYDGKTPLQLAQGLGKVSDDDDDNE